MELRTKTHGSFAGLVAGMVCLAAPALLPAASPTAIAGSITGVVTDTTGVPQMGATVLLFNRHDRLTEKALTDEKGAFVFAGLIPDIYSIRVTLASFVPAIRGSILVQPGMRSMLNVNLANLFSSIQLVYPGAEHRVLMNDEWKWVLRTSTASRPVLRLLPQIANNRAARNSNVFGDTRGLVRVSAGDGGDAAGFGGQGDLGTAFALATSLYGNNMLHVSGNVGYGSFTGAPSAAFRTSFTRNVGGTSPEVSVTMRQFYLPGRVGVAVAGGEGALPALRTMSVSFEDRTQISDSLLFHYGFSLDSVAFLDRLNYFSPFARFAYSLSDDDTVEFAYTSGNARPDLPGRSGGPGQELQRDLNSLAMMPRVSLRDGRARVQRGENFELSYTRVMGSRTVRVSGYSESVQNAALTVSAPADVYGAAELLPDLYSGNAVFNAGNYESLGYSASMTQNIGQNFSGTLMYGSLGALTADTGAPEPSTPDDLRRMIRVGRRHAATARVSATLPWSGTHMAGSYQWTDHKTLTPGHLYSTQSTRPEPGLNLYVRQPVPWPLFPWRMEISADLRNLLAQGYLPLNAGPGRRVLLMQTPRSFRGGLNFIF